MLRVDLRALTSGPVETNGTIAEDDPLFDGVAFTLDQPVAVTGRLRDSGPGRYFWQARAVTEVATSCRRCLTPVALNVSAPIEVLFTDDAAVEDPATYLIPASATELNLAETVREELILAVPEFVVCRDECRGLCPHCGKDLNEGPCDCRPEPDPRWAKLEALKGRRTDAEGT